MKPWRDAAFLKDVGHWGWALKVSCHTIPCFLSGLIASLPYETFFAFMGSNHLGSETKINPVFFTFLCLWCFCLSCRTNSEIWIHLLYFPTCLCFPTFHKLDQVKCLMVTQWWKYQQENNSKYEFVWGYVKAAT